MFKTFLCLKTKQNAEMSDEEHSDIEFYYPEEHGRHFYKFEGSGDTFIKISTGGIDFRNKRCHIIITY